MATTGKAQKQTDGENSWYMQQSSEYKRKRIEYQTEYRRNIRRRAIEAYGGQCTCCGTTEEKFLAFDHLNGKGQRDRKTLRTGNGWYQKLLKEHPSNIQLLCHNCNMAKGFYGSCPHESTMHNLCFDRFSSVGLRIY